MKKFVPVMVVVCMVAVAAFAARYEELIVTKLQVLTSAILPSSTTLNSFTIVGGQSASQSFAMEKGGATSVLATTVTQTLARTYIDTPVVVVTDGTGTICTNVVTSASNKFTVVYGATNITYRYSAFGRVL